MMPSGAHIMMLIDDEPAQQRLVCAIASRSGWRSIHASTAEMALAMLGTRDGMMLDVVVIDQSVPDSDCVALISQIRERRPSVPILVLTVLNSMPFAMDAMRAGATDFIIKPIAPDRLVAALEATICPNAPKGELRPLTEKDSAPLGFGEIVGSEPAFRSALAIAAKAARARVPVLIEGEAGVGKDIVAHAIHMSSAREKRPFVRVNCANIPTNLIESELFGHERGAFAGAFTRHDGKLLEADGGTIMLDEIEALPFDLHIKLLKTIESGEVHPIGARGFREVDIRVIAATNHNLLDDIMAVRFREDLYYRLATVQVSIPPLRERIADLPALVRHLLTRMTHHQGMRGLGITDDALALLAEFSWPGNIRQLQSCLFRAAISCERDTLTPGDFPEIAAHSKAPILARRTVSEAGVSLYQADGHMRSLEEIEADVIRLAIGHYRGRMTEVARRLNIGRSTLYRKLAELGISDVA
jgi:DNA-binding NtrC family response regulator